MLSIGLNNILRMNPMKMNTAKGSLVENVIFFVIIPIIPVKAPQTAAR